MINLIKTMKLYLLERADEVDYEEYISFIVAAESEEEALEWSPYGKDRYEYEYEWTTRDNVEIKYIGESCSNEAGIIHTSFRHG